MSDKKILAIEDIVDVDDMQFVEVDVPAWKGTVRLGSLPAGDMIDWVESNEGPAKRTAGIRLLVRSLVNAEGERIGTDKHVELFKRRDSKICNQLLDAILKLNGLNTKAQEAAKNDLSEVSIDASPTALH